MNYLGTPGTGPDPDFADMCWDEIKAFLDEYEQEFGGTYADPQYTHQCIYRETPDGYGCPQCMYG